MVTLKNLKFRTKILLLGIGSVMITILALVATVVWQSGQFNALAQDQFDQSAEADLSHIVEGVYNMVKAQDEAVQQQVNSSLHVAELVMHNAGQVRLVDEKVDWLAVNEATQQSINVQLPKMYVGDTWLGQYTRQYDTTPIVDHVQLIGGGTATIFQRMNEQGDMLRVATNILLPTGQRALGTFIPAISRDGSPDPVISAILRGSVYRGSTFAVDAWYDSAYEPVRDKSGQVIGMLYVGVKQESVESIRQAILRTQVGQAGYVYVLGSTGNEQGRYIISQKGQRDGENIWNAQDAEGHFIIQSIVNKALTLRFGETATERYQWQDPGDSAPRWKVARITYYEPWHWVIVASIDESELQAYRLILENGQTRMIAVAGAVGLAFALVAGLLSVLLARSITRPVDHLAGVAAQVSAGNLEVVAKVEQRDEIGMLATAFNSMTAQLHGLIGSLETRVELRTAQLRASADVGRAASSILNTDQLMREVVNLIGERFGFYYVAVFTLDETGQQAMLREATGEAGQLLKAQGHQLSVGGKSMVGYVTAQRKSRVALDVGVEAVRFANPLLPYTHSEIALPLIVGDTVIGALDVQSTKPAAFDENSAILLQAMADQIAVAINNAREYQHEQFHAEQTTRLLQAAIELAEQTDRATLENRVVQLAVSPFDADGAELWMEAEDELKLTAALNTNPAVRQSEPIGQDLANHVFHTGRILHVDNYPAWAGYAGASADAPFQAALAAPIVWRGNVTGVLSITRSRPGKPFTTDDENSAQLLATQVATAIENITLVEQQRRTLDELNAMNRRLTGEAWRAGALGGQVTYEFRHSPVAPVDLPGLSVQIPIELRDQPIGVVTLEDNDSSRKLTDDERGLIQGILQQMALALENQRLAETAQRAAYRDRTIAETADKIHRPTDLDAILRTALDEIARITGVGGVGIQLGFEPPHANGNGPQSAGRGGE